MRRPTHARRRSPLALVALVALVATLLISGCSSAGPDARSDARSVSPTTSVLVPPSSPSTPSSSAVGAAEVCGALPGARGLWLPITGGRLEANVAGAGPDAVVFLHEIGQAGMCGFDTYAAWLIRDRPGVQVILVNRCG